MAFSLRPTKLPPLPDNYTIHTLENSTLARAKKLLIASILLILAYCILAIAGSSELARKILLLFAFASFVCTAFGFFYISKLSLRKRVFKLYVWRFGLVCLFACLYLIFVATFSVEIDTLNFMRTYYGSDSIDIAEYLLEYPALLISFCLIAFLSIAIAISLIVIDWKIYRELSFVCYETLFFNGVKMLVFSLIGILLTCFIFLILLTLFQTYLTFILYSFIILLFVFIIVILCGTIMLYGGIFRLDKVIAYGENVENPI